MRIHLLMATAALALCAGSAQAEFSLHVLHINDFHSRIEPINKFDSTCTEKDALRGSRRQLTGCATRCAPRVRMSSFWMQATSRRAA